VSQQFRRTLMTTEEQLHTRYCLLRNREIAVVVFVLSLLLLLTSIHRLTHPVYMRISAVDYIEYWAGTCILLYLMRILRCRYERLLLAFVAIEQAVKPLVIGLGTSKQVLGRALIVALWAGAVFSSGLLALDRSQSKREE